VALVDLERAVVALCFGPMPSPQELERVGDPRIWGLYRRLVRGRFREEYKRAFKRSFALLGREVFEDVLAHHFAHDPPRTRFFYAIAAELARSAVPYLRARADVAAHAADLVAYEATLWTVSDLPDVLDEAPGEVGFDKRAVLAPALQLLALDHPVHEKSADGTCAPRSTHLCVYRRPEDKRARTWAVNGVSHDLLVRFARGDETIADSVRHVATARGVIVDEAFLDGLSTVLASAMQRGVLLGGR